jgi:hypothetical protein
MECLWSENGAKGYEINLNKSVIRFEDFFLIKQNSLKKLQHPGGSHLPPSPPQ